MELDEALEVPSGSKNPKIIFADRTNSSQYLEIENTPHHVPARDIINEESMPWFVGSHGLWVAMVV